MILQQTQHSIASKARVARAHRAYSCIGRANCNLRLWVGFEKQLKSVYGAADSVKRFLMMMTMMMMMMIAMKQAIHTDLIATKQGHKFFLRLA